MKIRGAPFPPALLLLLLGLAAWNTWSPSGGSLWTWTGLSLAALAGVLFSGRVPARVWGSGGLVLGLIALYAWNASYQWIDGRGLVPLDHVRGLPASAFPEGTWEAFRVVLAALAVFALALRLSLRQVRWLQRAAVVAAVGMALLVLMQRLEPNPFHVYEHTGIFVNENHFAVFSNLLLPVVLARASRARFRAVQEGRPSSPAGLYLLAAVLMAAAVVLCRSRAGVAVMALLVAAHVGLCRRTIRDYPFVGLPFSAWAKGTGCVAIMAAAGFAARAFGREWRQLSAIGNEWAFRSGILKDALAAWRERPVWGTGPGTFTAVFPYYQSAPFDGITILHAHCEPVQFLMEFGMAGALVAVAAAVLLLSARGFKSAPSDEIPPFADLERRAFGFGLLACAPHCLVDFPLRITLIALLAAAWAGVWAATRPIPAAGSTVPKE